MLFNQVNYIKIEPPLAGTSGETRITAGSPVIRARATEVQLYMYLDHNLIYFYFIDKSKNI